MIGEREVRVTVDLRGLARFEASEGQRQLEIRRVESLVKDTRAEKWVDFGILPSGKLIVGLLQGGILRGSIRRNRKAAVNTTQPEDGYSLGWKGSDPDEGILMWGLRRDEH